MNFDPEEDCFTLNVNDEPIMDLPYQATSAPSAPQLIMNNSKIYLNDEDIEMVRKEWSVEQF